MLTEPLRFDKFDDVARRIHKTIITCDGRPMYVDTVFPNLHVRLLDIRKWTNLEENPPTLDVHSSDTRIDLESPRLGWSNIYTRGAYRPIYFLRTVHRQFSQGIDLRRIVWIDPLLNDGDLVTGWRWRAFRDIIPLFNTIAGVDFPSIAAASESEFGAAFDRDWALTPTKSLNIRTIYSDASPVGYLNRSTKSFVFAKGMLTKVRRMNLERILTKQGGQYGITEYT